MSVDSEKIFNFPTKWKHITLLEVFQNKLFIIQENFSRVFEVSTPTDHGACILKGIKKKLDSFACIWLISFELEETCQYLFATIEETTISIFLKEDCTAIDQLQPFKSPLYLVNLIFLQESLTDET